MTLAIEYLTIVFLSLLTASPVLSADGKYLDYETFDKICRLFPELQSPRIPGLTETGHQLWKSGQLRLPAETHFVLGDFDHNGTNTGLLVVSNGAKNSVLVVEMEGTRVGKRRQLISPVPGRGIAVMDGGGFQLDTKVFLVADGGGLKLVEGEAARLEYLVFPSYRRELANASEPNWNAVNLLDELARLPSGFAAEARTTASTPGQVEVVLRKSAGKEFRFATNSEGSVIVAGDLLYFTSFSQIASGMSLVAYDLREGRELWRRQLKGLGPVAHSGYRNFGAHLGYADGAIRVSGQELYGAYLEYVRVRDGQTVVNKVFMHARLSR